VSDSRQITALGKDTQGLTVPNVAFFTECRPFGTRQNYDFAECQSQTLGKIEPLPSAKPRHSTKYFFCFWPPIFLVDLYLYHEQHVQNWHNFVAFWYISLVYFIFLHFSGKSKFELQVHRIIDFIRSKNVILVFWC
jgi:hypothetical protein